MNNSKTSMPAGTSFLQVLYYIFITLPNKFRDRIAKECGFSFPTFYRRIGRPDFKTSNADKDKIAQVAIECLQEAIEECKNIISTKETLN